MGHSSPQVQSAGAFCATRGALLAQPEELRATRLFDAADERFVLSYRGFSSV